MIKTIPHEDGSVLILAISRDRVSLGVRGPEAPASPPIFLTLPEVESLQKALGTMAAQLRGAAAKPNG